MKFQLPLGPSLSRKNETCSDRNGEPRASEKFSFTPGQHVVLSGPIDMILGDDLKESSPSELPG